MFTVRMSRAKAESQGMFTVRRLETNVEDDSHGGGGNMRREFGPCVRDRTSG
jgi:hypothetical protein